MMWLKRSPGTRTEAPVCRLTAESHGRPSKLSQSSHTPKYNFSDQSGPRPGLSLSCLGKCASSFVILQNYIAKTHLRDSPQTPIAETYRRAILHDPSPTIHLRHLELIPHLYNQILSHNTYRQSNNHAKSYRRDTPQNLARKSMGKNRRS